MSQPQPYVIATSFASDEAGAVSGRSTVRTAALDTELANIQTTVNKLVTNIGLIQRDDTGLMDMSVSVVSLSPAVLALLGSAGFTVSNPLGWLTATTYPARVIVTNGTGTYVSAVAHVSGVFATDLAAGKWATIFNTATFAAAQITFTPAGTIAATNVQAAIQEVATEAADSANITFLQSGTGGVSRTVSSKLRDLRSVFDFMTTAEIAAYQTNVYSGAVTNVTAAVQAAITAGNVYFPEGTARLNASLTGASSRLLWGYGTIDVASMYGTGKLAAINLDGVSDFTVDGLTFHSDALNDREAAVFLKDTTTPCSDITVRNCKFNNIKGITTWDGSGAPGGLFPAHYTGAYPSNYYQTDSKLHRRIAFTDNTLVNLTAAADTNGYGVWLWFCRDVLVARNKVKDLFAVAMFRGGDPANANWTVSRQASYNIVVEGNVADVQTSGVVLVGARNAVVANNNITAAAASAEIFDSEGGRDILFRGNTVNGGQTPLNSYFTNNNVVFDGNFVRATVYSGGAAGNGIYRSGSNSTDPDFTNTGKVILRNNTLISDVGEAWVGPGWCNEFVFENNHGTNVSFFSSVGTNLLTVRGNTFDFTISPTLKNLIEVGAANTAAFNVASSSPAPRIEIKDNIINGLKAAGVVADAVKVRAFTQAGTMDIVGNRLDNTGGYGIHLAVSGGVARTINVVNNIIRNDGSTTPFLADAAIANDVVFWADNRKFDGSDTFGAITGAPATNLTVDAKAITKAGSKIISVGPFAAANPYGWLYDSASTTWVKFGVTY